MACRAGGCYNKAMKHPHCGNKSCCLDVIFDHYSCTGLHSFAVCKICNDGDVVNDRLEIHVMTHNNSNTGCAGPTLIRIGDTKRMAIDVIEMGRRIQQIYCLEIDYSRPFDMITENYRPPPLGDAAGREGFYRDMFHLMTKLSVRCIICKQYFDCFPAKEVLALHLIGCVARSATTPAPSWSSIA